MHLYRVLVISSQEGESVEAIKEQIQYLEQFNIKVDLLIDPDELTLIETIEQTIFNCAYIHVKRRINSTYDPTKLLESYKIPLVGNHYITQLLVADKCLTSLKSGIGMPNCIVSKQMAYAGAIPYEKISSEVTYPVIVKPNTLHASQGITKDSVVFEEAKLKEAMYTLFEKFPQIGEVLIEHFAQHGKEYTVAVLGNGDNLVCSVSRIDYFQPTNINLYSENEKLLPLAKRSFSFNTEENIQIRERLEYHSKTLFRHFNLKDFARFDMIYDQSYYLLEANSCPIPGNSFSWEWQEKYGLRKEQTLALYLCAFHFGQICSGRCDNLPQELIDSQPNEIIQQINNPQPIDICPECAGPTPNCLRPELYSMNSRVGSETEVSHFLEAIVYLLKPNFILETGTYHGNGTIAFIRGILKNQFGHITTLEKDPNMAKIAQNNLAGYPAEVICIDSLSYTPTEKIDLLFLDSKRTLRKQEFLKYKPFLHKHSLIIWHDSSYREHNHAVFDAINELYDDNVIDRLLLPTPRGITLTMLK